jgi:hypothetical protein
VYGVVGWWGGYDRYELALCTAGSEEYATEMALLLDPSGELFAGRVHALLPPLLPSGPLNPVRDAPRSHSRGHTRPCGRKREVLRVGILSEGSSL